MLFQFFMKHFFLVQDFSEEEHYCYYYYHFDHFYLFYYRLFFMYIVLKHLQQTSGSFVCDLSFQNMSVFSVRIPLSNSCLDSKWIKKNDKILKHSRIHSEKAYFKLTLSRSLVALSPISLS